MAHVAALRLVPHGLDAAARGRAARARASNARPRSRRRRSERASALARSRSSLARRGACTPRHAQPTTGAARRPGPLHAGRRRGRARDRAHARVDSRDDFNGSRRVAPGRRALRVRARAARSTRRRPRRSSTTAGPTPTTLGPAPALWVPGVERVDRARERSGSRRGTAADRDRRRPRSRRTPLVIAHAGADGARARVAGHAPSAGATSAQLAAQPARLGRVRTSRVGGVPARQGATRTRSTTGLLATIAVARLGDPRAARALESSVIYYGDATVAVPRQLVPARRSGTSRSRTCRRSSPTSARSPRTTQGSPNGVVPADGDAKRPSARAAGRDHAARRRDIESDNPLAPVDAPWVDARSARPAPPRSSRSRARPSRRPRSSCARVSRADGNAASTSRARRNRVGRRRARPSGRRSASGRACCLLFDVSDSMGDPSDPRDPEQRDQDRRWPSGPLSTSLVAARARRRGRAAHLHDRLRDGREPELGRRRADRPARPRNAPRSTRAINGARRPSRARRSTPRPATRSTR